LEIWHGGVDHERARHNASIFTGERQRKRARTSTIKATAKENTTSTSLATTTGSDHALLFKSGIKPALLDSRNAREPAAGASRNNWIETAHFHQDCKNELRPCPVELERQLPPLPTEYRRGVIGAHIVIFNRNTNVIVDVLKDVAH